MVKPAIFRNPKRVVIRMLSCPLAFGNKFDFQDKEKSLYFLSCRMASLSLEYIMGKKLFSKEK